MAPWALPLLLLALPGAPQAPPPRCSPPPQNRGSPPGTYPRPPGWGRQRGGPGGRPGPDPCRAPPRCPAPLSFPNGAMAPRLPAYPPGSAVAFECDDGFVLRGAQRLRCQQGGVWSGAPPVCDDGAGDCPPAGAPAGGVTTGGGRWRGAEVGVRCGPGLQLLGPPRRRCLDTGQWSGPEPSCRHPFSFDTPEDVSAGLGASFGALLERAGARSDNGSSLGRRVVLSRSGALHVYILLDASGSVGPGAFGELQRGATALVDRLSSFEVPLRFAAVSFGSRARVALSTAEDASADADEVIERLNNITLAEHGNATGTNARAALMEVYHMVLYQKERAARAGQPDAWRQTRHVVFLLTDGRFNVGGNPREAVAKIEDALETKPDRREFLEIYAFGVGALEVDLAALEAVVSGGGPEPRAFKLRDAAALARTLEGALALTSVGDLCGVVVGGDAARPPWHVVLKTGAQQRCGGALVGGRWVLTAAHCFLGAPAPRAWSAELGGGRQVPIRGWVSHQAFDVRGGAARGVPEFYDYDVALVELEAEPDPQGPPRRVCIPCTEDANRALRKPPGTSCEEQEAELLGRPRVPAEFVSLQGQRLRVNVKEHEARAACEAGAVQPGTPLANASLGAVLTPRFLCTGQESGGQREDAACKGESGSSLFLQRRHRFIQVGVLSWGTFDPCRGGGRDAEGRLLRAPPPPGHRPRDFHISLFRVQPWLRQHLGGRLRFAPLRAPQRAPQHDP